MKTIILAIAIALASISAASAYQQCTTNCYGNTCNTTCF